MFKVIIPNMFSHGGRIPKQLVGNYSQMEGRKMNFERPLNGFKSYTWVTLIIDITIMIWWKLCKTTQFTTFHHVGGIVFD